MPTSDQQSSQRQRGSDEPRTPRSYRCILNLRSLATVIWTPGTVLPGQRENSAWMRLPSAGLRCVALSMNPDITWVAGRGFLRVQLEPAHRDRHADAPRLLTGERCSGVPAQRIAVAGTSGRFSTSGPGTWLDSARALPPHTSAAATTGARHRWFEWSFADNKLPSFCQLAGIHSFRTG